MLRLRASLRAGILSLVLIGAHCWTSSTFNCQCRKTRTNSPVVLKSSKTSESDAASQTRRLLMNGAIFGSIGSGFPREALAAGTKSRTAGYSVQKSDEEWKSLLTQRQYDILRNSGTERPYTSILESEDRPGIFNCAGCGTALFASQEKFHSGTGWPSFALGLEGVEVEKVGLFQANLGGAEIRCSTCGGHLGDVFNDGFLFVGTPAAATGKRFCVDGVALVFKSQEGEEVIGDEYPTKNNAYFPG